MKRDVLFLFEVLSFRFEDALRRTSIVLFVHREDPFELVESLLDLELLLAAVDFVVVEVCFETLLLLLEFDLLD